MQYFLFFFFEATLICLHWYAFIDSADFYDNEKQDMFFFLSPIMFLWSIFFMCHCKPWENKSNRLLKFFCLNSFEWNISHTHLNWTSSLQLIQRMKTVYSIKKI
jgi:hypothetical protein